MKPEEILHILEKGANFKFERCGSGWWGFGAINAFPECNEMSPHDYDTHYYRCKQLLENLPWNMVVKNPRYPKSEEYPTVNGEYITMLDCDEHMVICNTFRNGRWAVYNRTHVKWWMPISKLLRLF